VTACRGVGVWANGTSARSRRSVFLAGLKKVLNFGTGESFVSIKGHSSGATPNSKKLFFQPTEKKRRHANRAFSRLNAVCEPEQRLWKISAKAISPTIAAVELFVVILFLAVAGFAVFGCFAELFQLFDNDAVGWVARKAIGGV
jgi:hypothetical protein